MYSELISTAIATGGPHAAKTSAVKLMRRCAALPCPAIRLAGRCRGGSPGPVAPAARRNAKKAAKAP